jgi:hypothetical protein
MPGVKAAGKVNPDPDTGGVQLGVVMGHPGVGWLFNTLLLRVTFELYA